MKCPKCETETEYGKVHVCVNGKRAVMCKVIPAPVPAEERYRRALEGIASCATKCGCCEMHRRVANEALGR